MAWTHYPAKETINGEYVIIKLTKKEFIITLVYSISFPVFVTIGIETGYEYLSWFALIISFPFVIIGWMGGMFFAGLFNTESAYPVGLSIAIFLQVFIVTIVIKNIISFFSSKRFKY